MRASLCGRARYGGRSDLRCLLLYLSIRRLSDLCVFMFIDSRIFSSFEINMYEFVHVHVRVYLLIHLSPILSLLFSLALSPSLLPSCSFPPMISLVPSLTSLIIFHPRPLFLFVCVCMYVCLRAIVRVLFDTIPMTCTNT